MVVTGQYTQQNLLQQVFAQRYVVSSILIDKMSNSSSLNEVEVCYN